jgi:prophage regulatory protein
MVERILRKRELPAVTGYHATRISELIQEGSFPAPIKLGMRSIGWLESEISEWQRQRIEQRDAEQAKRKLRVPSIDEVAAELSEPGKPPHRPRNRLQPRRR